MNSEAIQEKSFLDCRVGNKFYLSQNLTFSQLLLGRVRNDANDNDKKRGSFRLPFTFHPFTHSTAFTLAEVLITLVVIGVVSALTIPALIESSQKQQTVTKLQKAFSTLSNAYKMAEVDYGALDTWSNPTVDWDTAASNVWWTQYSIIPYLSVVKQCTGYTGCWASDAKYLDGTLMNPSTSSPFVILNDGTAIYFELVKISPSSGGMIYFDINGIKTPNIVGKDIFCVIVNYPRNKVILENSLAPRAWILTDANTTCNTNTGYEKGRACGGLIQLDGWKIKDDYPWN